MKTRQLLFLLGCLGVRSGLAFLAYKTPEKYLYWFGILGLVLAIGFLRAIIVNRKHGPEMLGNDPIWWGKWRYFHLVLWLSVSIVAFSKKKWVWVLLAVDVVVGLLAFTLHYGFNIQ